MTSFGVIFNIFSFIAYFMCYSFGYIELIAGNHLGDSHFAADSPKSALHRQFIPQIAFQCGYRNRYLSRNGDWVSDRDVNAVCLTGKLDILKYCRKSYPDLQITNFVQSEELVTIDDWCKAGEGKPCKWSFLTRPYRCIVGEFESEALLVPQGCHFGHVDDRAKCNDFQYWNLTAQLECAKRLGDLKVQSFAMLQPCGLDLFNGVEYVCCPKHQVAPEVDLHVKVKLEKEKSPENSTSKMTKGYATTDDEDDSSDEDDVDDDDDFEASEFAPTAGTTPAIPVKVKPAKKAAASGATKIAKPAAAAAKSVAKTSTAKTIADDDSSEEDGDLPSDNEKSGEQQDVYFRIADPDFEHDRYREALERLERKHRSKVAKVMKEWSDLETRYQSMLQKDPKGAQTFKNVITKRFQTTVAALEEENREERRQIEDVHDQRVDAVLNERKREAIKRYRDALAERKPSVDRILHGLKAYVRAEEKDRFRQLNRYRLMLKRDSDLAAETKPKLLRRLREIDLRINSTIGLLKELPADLEKELKTDIRMFWQDLRAQNTPKSDEEGLLNLDYSKSDLIDEYKRQYQTERIAKNQEKLKVAVDSFVSTSQPTPIISSVAQQAATSSPNLHTVSPNADAMAAKAVVKKFENIMVDTSGKKSQDKRITLNKNDKTEKVDKKSEVKPVKKLLSPNVVVFDPVVEIADDFKDATDDEGPQYSYARKSVIQHPESVLTRHVPLEDRGGYAYVLVGLAGVTLLVSLVMGVAFVRRRYTNRGRGFIEVDACTPEERHVAMMQGNGYENPTYKYFDEKM